MLIDGGQRLARSAFWGLLALLAWAPLPLGSNRPWSWSLISLIAGILLIIWALAVLADPAKNRLAGRRLLAPSMLYGIVVLWGLLQASTLTPASWGNPLWADAAAVLDRRLDSTISVDPAVSIGGAIRLLAYGVIFWMAAQFGRDRNDGRTILWCIVIVCVAYAVYGLMVFSSGNTTILFYTKWAFPNDLTGTFIARSAYGIYAGIGLLTALALLVDTISRNTPQTPERRSIASLIDSAPPAIYGLVFASVLLGTTMVLSHSRGALAATGFGILTMFAVLLARAGKRRRPIALTLIATALAGLLVLEISGDHTLGRILANADQGFSKPGFGRDAIHATAGRAIEAAPLTGHGLDTFRQVVYQYRTEDLVTSWVRIDKAHSVYLELITELGYIGFALLMAAMAWILGTIALGLMRRRRDFIFPSLVLGSAALIGTHNLLDFSIQMPAIAVTWAAMLGVGYAQAWGSDDFSRAGYVRTENALIPRCQGDGNFK
jgi:O-antigen ligase